MRPGNGQPLHHPHAHLKPHLFNGKEGLVTQFLLFHRLNVHLDSIMRYLHEQILKDQIGHFFH